MSKIIVTGFRGLIGVFLFFIWSSLFMADNVRFLIPNQLLKKNLQLCLYVGIATLILPEICAAITAVDGAAHADLTPHTTKFVGHVKSNLVPIASVVGVVIGFCRSFMTQSLTPLAICGGAGIASGMLLDYFATAFPMVL
jgi:hypothetical protein